MRDASTARGPRVQSGRISFTRAIGLPFVCALVWNLLVWGPATVPARASEDPDTTCGLRFLEVARARGIDFVHRTGAAGDQHLPETMGAGVAFLDYDGDGWPDLYFVQSGPFPPSGSSAGSSGRGDRLYRNLGGSRNDGRRFEPVELGEARANGYGQGVVAADLDGDADLDLVLTGYDGDSLLFNRGDGRFESRGLDSSSAGPRSVSPQSASPQSASPQSVASPSSGESRWSSSAAVADVDGDGDLDLYVTGYLAYRPDHGLFCGELEEQGLGSGGGALAARRDYCDPSLFDGLADRLYGNDGNGRFHDVTLESGLEKARGKALGVVMVDLDGDLRPEIYVANDITPNLLFHNLGGGRFEDVSLISGAAVNREGRPEAGMGIVAADFDRDGDLDLGISHFDVETNTLYRNDGDLFFEDVSVSSGFGLPSFNRLGFGIVAGDFDLDGDLDVYVANGHIFERPKRENVSHAQPDLWLAGDGMGHFREAACRFVAEVAVGRGAAVGDFDLDGDLDIVVSNSNGPPFLLENLVHQEAEPKRAETNGAGDAKASPGPWVGVELVGLAPNTGAIGARVAVEAGGSSQEQWVMAGSSYLSSNNPRLSFALPEGAERGATIEVTWPSGKKLRVAPARLNRYQRIVERR